jgi:hypothetical protein
VLKGLGIGGGSAAGIGFILGLLLIWWLEPPIADARHFLMLAPTIVAGAIGAIFGGIMGRKKSSKKRHGDSSKSSDSLDLSD